MLSTAQAVARAFLVWRPDGPSTASQTLWGLLLRPGASVNVTHANVNPLGSGPARL